MKVVTVQKTSWGTQDVFLITGLDDKEPDYFQGIDIDPLTPVQEKRHSIWIETQKAGEHMMAAFMISLFIAPICFLMHVGGDTWNDWALALTFGPLALWFFYGMYSAGEASQRLQVYDIKHPRK